MHRSKVNSRGNPYCSVSAAVSKRVLLLSLSLLLSTLRYPHLLLSAGGEEQTSRPQLLLSINGTDIRPVKLTDEVLVWLSVGSEVQIVCIYGPTDATASQNPIVSCLI